MSNSAATLLPAKPRGSTETDCSRGRLPLCGSSPKNPNPAFMFRKAVEQSPVRMKDEMPGCRARLDRDEGRIGRGELAGRRVEAPDIDPVEPGIAGDDEASGRVGPDHMDMGGAMIALSEIARRLVRGPLRIARPAIGLEIDRPHETATRPDRQNGAAAAAVIRHEHETARRMHAEMRRRAAARSDGV